MTQQVSRCYLAVSLPWLATERIRRAKPPDGPFALVEKIKNALCLAAVDGKAQALGLTTGLALADARARVPELIVFDTDPAADTAMLGWLAEACDRYTPLVAIDQPNALILDITGCQGSIADDLAAQLKRLQLTAHIAHASTPDAALALARHGGEDIRALPVEALRVDAALHLALRRAGLKNIADLVALPSAPLAARFGTAVPALLARLCGDEDIRITPRRAPAEIEREARFAEPIARTEDMLATISRLVGAVATDLSARGAGGRRFAVALFRSDGHVARLSVETGQPTRDAMVLDRLFRERIDALADPIDPGFGYDLVRLSVDVVEPLVPEQYRLDGDKGDHGEVAALIDRLGVRLGRGRVRRFTAVDTHIPEQATLELPVAAPRPPVRWSQPEAGEPPLRPIHLFDPPQRIEVVAEVPDGPPRRFKWRRAMHDVARYEGPERIAAEWWMRRDNGGLTRDYYRVEDVRGRRYWLFRHGLYGSEKPHPDWYLHGLFA